VHGFGRAVGLDPRNLKALMKSRDEDLSAAVDGMNRYMLMLDEQSPTPFEGQLPEVDDDPDLHVTMTAYFAETIYRRLNRLKRVVMGVSPVAPFPRLDCTFVPVMIRTTIGVASG
jgi:hypothetical protein